MFLAFVESNFPNVVGRNVFVDCFQKWPEDDVFVDGGLWLAFQMVSPMCGSISDLFPKKRKHHLITSQAGRNLLVEWNTDAPSGAHRGFRIIVTAISSTGDHSSSPCHERTTKQRGSAQLVRVVFAKRTHSSLTARNKQNLVCKDSRGGPICFIFLLWIRSCWLSRITLEVFGRHVHLL